MNQTLRILIVDDDEVDRMAVRRALKVDGLSLKISEAGDCATAIAQVDQHPFDCIFVDYRLPDSDGLALVKQFRSQGLTIPLIALTGQGDDQIAVELMKAGASDYLSKSRINSGRLVQTLQSVMRLHQAEQEAALATQQKEELAKQREDFVSRMTHDLRTPLIAANRMLQLFQEEVYGDITPEMDKAIAVIIRSNHNLLEMVNNLLEVYCHEAGYKQLNFTNVDLEEVISEVVQELNPLAEQKHIALTAYIDDNANSVVMGDRVELRRVFINLVSNAIKFTDEGYIKIELTEHDSLVTVHVQDTGSGIRPEDQAVLFERFRQGNHKRSTSGLGLYLSRRIIEVHQGTITVQSEVGKGSIFRVQLQASQE
ncbi:hybrid sensor histidine kinase/response regulator [Chroococcus sp. FPU101]|uniref:hybrid sensor histidine kinase/response regulator n=1 Tax=Chroococcus sp. FPU101 TaxID=1974212 RepID=UPI001A8DD79D|nr:hybrid sensor histidine kinase/response regulator [Chroococcus sp. FPU101]GFE68647.1 two-component hybrid sensor and regulator [Chroococcus sp. FPU101]